MLKQLINNHLEKNIKDKNDVAILFSGGLDSLSILLSCLEIDIRPVLYSFYLKSHVSDDIEASRKIAIIYNLKLIEIVINDTDINQLKNDVHYIINKYHLYKKTAVQCVYPFIYIIPVIKEKYILTGLCADDLYGTPRSMAKYRNDFDTFNEIRENKIQDITASAYSYIKSLVEENNKIFIAPYKDNLDLLNYFRGLNYKDMNSPKQKNIMYQDYKEEIDKYKLYRINQNLQCGSKIREWHDNLLLTELNTKNYKVVNPIYKNIYKEISIENTIVHERNK